MRQKNVKAPFMEARLDALGERMDGIRTLSDERWRAHDRLHEQLAHALDEYKKSANEWRGLVSDFRATTLTEAQYETEQRSLRTEMGTSAKEHDRRLKVLEDASLVGGARTDGTRSFLSDTRSVVLLVVAVASMTITALSLLRDMLVH